MPLIAVIDDDERFRMALVERLCSLGYRVRDFESAEGFIEEQCENSFDCIITDIHMPGMSGLDLMQLLAVRSPEVPVIMITALSEPELEVRVGASGAVFLLRKPLESNALISCLEAALRA